MTGIKSQRQKEYNNGREYSNSYVEVTMILDKDITRKKQHLIEEKVDLLFDEIDSIMAAS